MKNIIIKKASPLSILVLLAMGSISMESLANDDEGLFLSKKHNGILALNGGMRGKPPYNRANMKRQSNKNQRSVEMSALEIDRDGTRGSSLSSPSKASGRYTRGGHPYHSKRYTNRY